MNDVDVLPIARGGERNPTRSRGKEGAVTPHADVLPRIHGRTVLPNEDIASDHGLAAEALDPETLGIGVATVPGGTAALLRGEELKIKSKHAAEGYEENGLFSLHRRGERHSESDSSQWRIAQRDLAAGALDEEPDQA